MTVTPLTALDLADASTVNARLAEIEAAILGDISIPAGTTFAYAGISIPIGYLLCDGSVVSRTTYAALFGVIGTTYGVGDGSTTFNLPDTRGRTLIGAGTGTGLTNRVLGTQLGEENHQLTIPEMAAHTHTYLAGTFDGLTIAGAFGEIITSAISTSAGSDTPHNNMQPSIAMNVIIKI